MSYDLLVYTRRERLPAPDRLRAELLALAPSVEVAALDLEHASGYVPAKRGGEGTGFDVLVASVDEDDIDDYKADLEKSGSADNGFLDVLTSSDTFISVSGKSSTEIEAARAVAEVIARLSRGYLYDPQAGAVLSSTTVP